MNKQELGYKIYERRQQLQLKQEDLSEMAGVTIRTIYQVENGTGNPSLDTITKIINILGLEIKLIIKGTDNERSSIL